MSIIFSIMLAVVGAEFFERRDLGPAIFFGAAAVVFFGMTLLGGVS